MCDKIYTSQDILGFAKVCLTEEAEAIKALIPQLNDDFVKAVTIIYNCKGKVIVTGVGKSGNIGTKIAATFSSTGTPAFFVNPLDVFHGDLGVVSNNDVILALSNSGNTDELLRFVPFLQRINVPIISLTGNPNSLLARHSTAHICVSVKKEACPLNLAPTNSTTAALAMGDALAVALMYVRDFKPNDFAQFHPGGALGKRLLTEAKDVMHTENLPILQSNTNLGEAIIQVSKGKLGLGIAIKNGKVQGLITDGDIRRAMEKWQAEFFNKTVDNIMTRNPKTVLPHTKISEIQKIMQNNKIHSVLVVSTDNELLGVVDNYSCMID